MSGILNLATSMQERSEKLVEDTTKSVDNALKRHEQTISEELKSSEKDLRNSIQNLNQSLLQSHQRSLKKLQNSQLKVVNAMSKWFLIPTVSLLVVIFGLWGTMYFLGSQAKENISHWNRSKELLSSIPQVRDYGTHDGKNYIVLRKGKYSLVPQKDGSVVVWEK